MKHNLFIQSPVDGLLGCFVLTTMNKIARIGFPGKQILN